MVDVTGLGSLPGTDFPAAVRMTFDEVGVPYLPELPARGPHASMLARGAASLAGLNAELTTSGWRLSASPGPDLRRARALLRDDLDMLAESVPDHSGVLRVSLVGPWTLSAGLERPRGGSVLSDVGARRDIAASLQQGSADLLDEIARRLPAATVTLQLDEPSLPAVLGGTIPTAGGLFALRAIDEAEAFGALRGWAGELPGGRTPPTVLHCCAPGLPLWRLLRDTGLRGVCVDLAMLRTTDVDALAAALDAGHDLFLGVVGEPTTDARQAISAAWALLSQLSPGPDLATRLTVTPACGLATWDPASARSVWRTLGRVALDLDERLLG